jgi:hypothetical protein
VLLLSRGQSDGAETLMFHLTDAAHRQSRVRRPRRADTDLPRAPDRELDVPHLYLLREAGDADMHPISNAFCLMQQTNVISSKVTIGRRYRVPAARLGVWSDDQCARVHQPTLDIPDDGSGTTLRNLTKPMPREARTLAVVLHRVCHHPQCALAGTLPAPSDAARPSSRQGSGTPVAARLR